MRRQLALLLTAYASLCLAAPDVDRVEYAPQPYDFERSRAITSGEWVAAPEPVDATHPMTLYFALEPRNLDTIRSVALSVSDPTSASYGKHLNAQQIAAIVSPPESEIDTVLAFLKQNRIEAHPIATRHMVHNL